MATITKITLPDESIYDLRASSIPYGAVDSSSTSTAFTATVPGITALTDGVCVLLKNGVVTSAANFTININNLGAKPVYSNMATGNDTTPTAPTRETTIFNINYTMMLFYSSTIVDDGGWICYRGYDANTNTIGYQLRTNSALRKAADKGYKYRLWFRCLDGTYAPANTSSSTNATARRTPNTRTIDPFGEIIYCSTNGTTNADANLAAGACWSQYVLALGYSFNDAGAALTLTNPAPVYVQCTPQTSGGVKINGYTQELPSTDDGKVYIYLGMAYSATNIELVPYHPVYYYSNGAIRLWTNAESGGTSVEPATASPSMDGTAAVGTSVKYAREDHVHPSDTSKQDTLVSGTNIKTVNNESLLGSGNVTISGGTALTTLEIEAAVDDAFQYETYLIEDVLSYYRSITNDGSYGNNITEKIASAQNGDTITYSIETSISMNRVIQTESGDSITDTYITSYEYSPGGGGGQPVPPPTSYSVYSFTMPSDNVIMNVVI